MAFRNADEIDKKIREIVTRKVRTALNNDIIDDYVDTLKDRIVQRTQLGIGFDPATGNTERFPPLSENYKEMRQGKARWYTDRNGRKIKVKKKKENSDFVRKPRLASTTTPAKSNVTATGQLLKALTVVKIKSNNVAEWLITVGDRRGRGLFDYPSKIGNKRLVDLLERKGRFFLGFTRPQRNQIAREIAAFLRALIKNNS